MGSARKRQSKYDVVFKLFVSNLEQPSATGGLGVSALEASRLLVGLIKLETSPSCLGNDTEVDAGCGEEKFGSGD
jgi:hypothetical protein